MGNCYSLTSNVVPAPITPAPIVPDQSQIFVKTLDGQTVSLDVDFTTDTLQRIKYLLYQKTSLSLTSISLEFNGRDLRNDTTRLVDYDIKMYSVLHIKVPRQELKTSQPVEHGTSVHPEIVDNTSVPYRTVTLTMKKTTTVEALEEKLHEYGMDDTLELYIIGDEKHTLNTDKTVGEINIGVKVCIDLVNHVPNQNVVPIKIKEFFPPTTVHRDSDFHFMKDQEQKYQPRPNYVQTVREATQRVSEDTQRVTSASASVSASASASASVAASAAGPGGGPGGRHWRDQRDSDPIRRIELICWLLEVARQYYIYPNSVYVAVNWMDRYLSINLYDRSKLQMLGVTVLWMAYRYEKDENLYQWGNGDSIHKRTSVNTLTISECIRLCKNCGYTPPEIMTLERHIYETLQWNMNSSAVTSFSFLLMIRSIIPFTDNELVRAACLIDFMLMYDFSYPGSTVACAAAYVVFLLHGRVHEAKCVLAYGGYDLKDPAMEACVTVFHKYIRIDDDPLINLIDHLLIEQKFSANILCRDQLHEQYLIYYPQISCHPTSGPHVL